MQNLKTTLVQCRLAWESAIDNRHQFESMLLAHPEPGDLVVLPEMFTTGFSMNALANAELPGGETEQWMQSLATKLNCAITGSIAVKDGEVVFNRMLFATPDRITHYDKRHLFRMAGEHQRYAAGDRRVIVDWRGWRLKLEVCYDLRFPVFSRNRGDYDALINVANWPSKRAHHWRALLPARAIENSAYVIGVNRIGEDANGLSYVGDSEVIDFTGERLLVCGDAEGCHTTTLDAEKLIDYRSAFPVHRDADDFIIEL
ncbi:hydrolase YafV [Luminiphilus syltensis NOR5-1B]|uniref:Omega-amidase YafV n=1 Tax=Luminiphilus syltensis NOR5-1B TaxID=565045 RepID=B8KWQ3_9GAMM|nr:amidohydrolase [Luminiphilus syltensis]EED36021.1 hydrolase YafV [Luminiphilus syltensis NOR5-1B]